jgi:hypothetical protein
MRIFISILISFFSACGNNIKLKNNKLESQNNLSTAQLKKKSAIFKKGNPCKIFYEDKIYSVSIYSSKDSFDFSNTLLNGASVNVLFSGNFSGNEVVIETIVRQ